MKKLAEACEIKNGALLYYFGSKGNIVVESTAYTMAKVEEDFISRTPGSLGNIGRFIQEMPYITAKLPGAQYRFMYQVYASPKYREYDKEFLNVGIAVIGGMPKCCPQSWN